MTKYEIAENHSGWLEIRSRGLGGSDIGTVLGLNPYKSIYQLWLEKTGQVKPPDISDRIAIQVGNELEDLVARLFTQETGLKVQRDNKTHFHKKYDFMLANIDRKIVGERALLECKTTSAFNAEQWKNDEVPASYLMQVQHYLNVLDYDKAYIACLIGNHDFVWKEIKRDQELIDLYTKQATSFWNDNVLKNIAPEIDGSMVTKEALDMREYEPGKAEPLNKEQKDICLYINQLKEDVKTIQATQKEYENKLKDYMGQKELSELTSSDIYVTYSTVNQVRLDSARLKKEKPEIYNEYSRESSYKRLTIKEMG